MSHDPRIAALRRRAKSRIMESGREGRISAAASVLEIAREERPDESPFERFGPGESLILASCNGRWPDDARGD